MNLEAIRSFLHVVETGSFSLAASRVGVMQSTISGRILALENDLGSALFTRGRGGAELTPAGHDFRAYAEQIVQTWDNARQQITLPPGYTNIFRFGGPVGLHDQVLIGWVQWMKEHAPGIALQLEAGRSDMMIEALSARMMDAAFMYLPRQRPGLTIENFSQEDLILVAHPELLCSWQDNFVFVDWGHEFRTAYGQAFPESHSPTISVGLGALGLQYVLALKGAAYLPRRLVAPLLAEGRLRHFEDLPTFRHPVYLVYPTQAREPDLLVLALTGLRKVAADLGSTKAESGSARA
jgi:LysR family transcriptional regulator, flagellar master operon regulator